MHLKGHGKRHKKDDTGPCRCETNVVLGTGRSGISPGGWPNPRNWNQIYFNRGSEFQSKWPSAKKFKVFGGTKISHITFKCPVLKLKHKGLYLEAFLDYLT